MDTKWKFKNLKTKCLNFEVNEISMNEQLSGSPNFITIYLLFILALWTRNRIWKIIIMIRDVFMFDCEKVLLKLDYAKIFLIVNEIKR